MRADVVPTAKNTNGIYAVSTREQLGDFGMGAYGEIALSGTVIVGEHGYRGERATIRSLFLTRQMVAREPDGFHPPGTLRCWPEPEWIRKLEQRYAVAVTIVERQPRVGEVGFYGTLQAQNAQQAWYHQMLQQQMGRSIGRILGVPLGSL